MVMQNYKVYTSDVVINNKEEFINICDYASKMLRHEFQDADNTTWIYQKYNIFSYTASSTLFYDLYKDLNKCIRDYVGDDRRVWFQAWLNFLKYEDLEKVLPMHGHEWDLHGYISIDPKKSVTEFVNFEIKNEVGNIYMGPCGDEYRHRVKNIDKWDGNRITIGFDCTFDADVVSPNKLFPIL